MRVFAGVLAGGTVAVVAAIIYAPPPPVQAFFAKLAELALYVCWGGAILAGVAGVVALGVWVGNNRNEYLRQRDGAYARRVYQLTPLIMRLLTFWRAHDIIDYDPNTNVSHGAIIGVRGVMQLAPVAGWETQHAYNVEVEKTRRVQAAIPGDRTRGYPWYSPGSGGRADGFPNAATAKYAAGGFDKQAKIQELPQPAVPQLPAPAPADLTINDAVRSATSDWWTIGQANGQLVGFDPMRKPHIGIVGSTGTGKTTGMGFLIAAHALRNGWHVVIMDADDGAAWTAFSMQAERVETDGATFANQIGAVYTEFERRIGFLHTAGATDINGVANVRRMLVVIEEYGDLVRQLRIRDKAAADTVDSQLDGMMRRGRKAGVHLMLLDQYPEYWSQQVIAGAKLLCVYRLGPGQGNKVGYYPAHELTDTGEFAVDGQRCRSWHTAPALRKMLADIPALDVRARVIDGACSSVQDSSQNQFTTPVQVSSPRVDTLTSAPVNSAPDTVEGWYEWTLDNYLPTHTELLRTENGRGVGVKALAEMMATVARGNVSEYEAFKGAASEVAKRLRKEAALPGGDKLGVDVSKGGETC